MATVQFTVFESRFSVGRSRAGSKKGVRVMGKEVTGAVRAGKARYTGKILLETSEIIFRGADYRLKIPFTEIKGVTAVDGELCIDRKDSAVIFEVGKTAEKWREKILHPKSRAEKLGVAAGTQMRLIGSFEPDFMRELKASKAKILAEKDSGAADLTFFAAASTSDLTAFAKLCKKLRGADALWVVYPKGKKEITENDVLQAGRNAGLKDLKVVGFSATHTALKFVLPLDKR